MHPTNPKVLFSALAHRQPSHWWRPTGAESVTNRAKDSGKNWERLKNGLSDGDRDFAGSIIFDEANTDRPYAAFRSGGLYARVDSGDSWVKMDVSVSSVSDMKCAHAWRSELKNSMTRGADLV
jgi:hypothetical protein